MKVLVITRSSWRKDNSVGNTLENLFSGIDFSFDSISFRDMPSDNSVAKKCFHISDIQIIKKILGKINSVGSTEVVMDSKTDDNGELIITEKSLKNYSMKFNCGIAPFFQELLWNIGKWKNDKFDTYLQEVSPDIIFMPVFPRVYPHKVLKYIKQRTQGKVVLYHADDTYTFRQFDLNPLFWLYRIYLRKWVRNSVRISDLNYAISNIQKNEYEKIFDINFNILYKGADFVNNPLNKMTGIIKMIYTGNIDLNRWKTLYAVGKAIEDMDHVQFDIYTMTHLNNKMVNAFNELKMTKIRGAITAEQVKLVQEDSDILVHVESFDIKNRLKVHQSFSTKIVDYLSSGKCILAVGPSDVASIDYLKNNDAAYIITELSGLKEQLHKLLSSKKLILEYADKSWACGQRNHNIKKIQNGLKYDFESLIDNES